MRRKFIAITAAALCLCACLLALTGCGGDADKTGIKGQWQVKGTEMTVIFTDTQFKTSASTFEYSLDTGAKTITFKQGDDSGVGQYTFSGDFKELTLTEDENGTPKTTVFEKVSDDTSGEPSMDGTPAEQ